MRVTLHLLVLLMILYFVHGSSIDLSIPPDVKSTTFDLTGRIVNGTKAVLGQFPHQVSLKRSWSERHFCGGSIISPSLVLTAGHCMYLNGNVTQPWMTIVVGGIVKLNDMSSTQQQRDVENIKIHPKYNVTNLHNDVAILQLSKPFTFTPEVHSVPLSGNAPVPYTLCQVSGWGALSFKNQTTPPDLMYVDLPIRTANECRTLLENITDVSQGRFCAGYMEGGKDSCNGDSGGGMLCHGVLTGIVSGGIGCAEPLLPGLYTDVFVYLDWILKDIEVVVVMQINTENYGTSNTSSIMIMIIFFLFCAVIN